MLVGNGLIAKKFRGYVDDDQFLIFASGVSNSKNTLQTEFEREFELLKQCSTANNEKVFVYFSTCSVNDPVECRSEYVRHKQNVEDFIRSNMEHYVIFRVSNLVGKSANPNTVLNFIAHNIRNTIHFDLWLHATRNLIDVDDFFSIVNHILQNRLFSNQIVNIANPENYPVPEIVKAVEKHFNKKGEYTSQSKGGTFNIDVSGIEQFFSPLKISFGTGYLANLLAKYY
ncbi:MAG TPA: NAD(P)-dependent oxidoreductase [Chitinophagaceae bacterium]|nr:NAD(P)-dependent oxidoreductase [Chitinophagaceae bacterium]